ncbi:hypothetical protein PoB_003496300 [Plakobranchus ocellatus]|uniref:Uncharacterized protein n=1 Tax=Plakobranchus ocellatus TaxID=259542 RepID=A0AAV4API3_9GAST|nr:hypothetical protein PoB_003496300 [Plakobranchus ocellatus]
MAAGLERETARSLHISAQVRFLLHHQRLKKTWKKKREKEKKERRDKRILNKHQDRLFNTNVKSVGILEWLRSMETRHRNHKTSYRHSLMAGRGASSKFITMAQLERRSYG